MTAPLNTLLIGFGGIAHGLAADARMAKWFPIATHVQALEQSSNFQLIGIVDPDPNARATAVSDWGTEAFENIQAATALNPDVIVFATPPGERAEALAAFSSLKGVIVEKPLGGDDGRRLVDTCHARNIPIQVNYWRRGDATLQALAASNLKDRIGAFQAGHALYGNGLANNGSHLIDMIRMLLGEPVWVQVFGDAEPVHQSPIADDVHVAFALGFDNGACVSAHPVDFAQYREVSLDLWGTNGRLSFMQETLDIRHFDCVPNRGLDGAFEIASDAGALLPNTVASALPNLYENLSAAIDGKATLLSTGKSALKTETIIERIQLSANRRGERLDVIVDTS